eukprot:299306-Amorphochlora_amoeboformis.AAC.2
MVKLLRLFKIERNQFLAKIQRKYQIKYSTISLVKFLILLILGAHWLGCLFYSVSIVSGCDQPYCSWVVAQAESRHFFSPIDGQVCPSDIHTIPRTTLISPFYGICVIFPVLQR